MQHCNQGDILTVTTTVGTREDAKRLAGAILQARLAACVQVEEGLLSFYRWEGQSCEDSEVRLTIKTLPMHLQPLQALFAGHHPYALPQFVAWVGQGSDAYAEWVRAEAAPAA